MSDTMLDCGASYFLAITATNCAGLQSSISSAQSVRLCCDAPSPTAVYVSDIDGKLLSSVGGNSTLLNVSWAPFSEVCSGLRSYTVKLTNSATGVVDWSSEPLEPNVTWVEVPEKLVASFAASSAHVVSVSAESHAGLTSEASVTIVVDHTAPPAGFVESRWAKSFTSWFADSDGQNAQTVMCVSSEVFLLELSWEAMRDPESLTVFAIRRMGAWEKSDITSLSDGNFSTTFNGTIMAGAVLMAASTSNVTAAFGMAPAPIPGWYHANFTDQFHSTGREAIITLPTSALSSTAGMRFHVGACNVLGLCSQVASPLFQVVDSSPTNVNVELQPSENASVGYLSSLQGFVGATWAAKQSSPPPPLSPPPPATTSTQVEAIDSHSVPLSMRAWTFEACIGRIGFACEVPFVQSVSSSSWSTTNLSCGVTYRATVRATNCAGHSSVFSSKSARLCCDPPTPGHVHLHTASGGTLEYLGLHSTVTISWDGFSDTCAPIREYRAELRASGATSALWGEHVSVQDQARSNITHELPAGVLRALEDGATYVVMVIATSMAGISSSAVATFLVDLSPPTAGEVFNAAELHNEACESAAAPLQVSWRGFEDVESGIALLESAVGTTPGMYDISPYTPVHEGHSGDVARTLLPGTESHSVANETLRLAPGMWIFYSMRVTNRAGDAVTVSSPAQLVLSSYNCSARVVCLQSATPATAWQMGSGLNFSSTSNVSQVAAGFHPMFYPLLLGAFQPDGEYEYDMRTHASMPHAGRVYSVMNVRLKRVQSEGDHSMMRLSFVKGSTTIEDKIGTRMPLSKLKPEYRPEAFPLFYSRAEDGKIGHVLHHPDEHEMTLTVKKHLVSILQLRAQPLGHSSLYEQDTHGNASVKYHVRRGLQKRLLYQKQLEWPSTKADMLRHSASVHAIVDEASGVLRKMRVDHVTRVDAHDIGAQFAGGGTGDFSNTNIEGLREAIPSEPSVTVLTLKSGPVELHKRSLQREKTSDDEEEEADEEEERQQEQRGEDEDEWGDTDEEDDTEEHDAPPEYFVKSSLKVVMNSPEMKATLNKEKKHSKKGSDELKVVTEALLDEENAPTGEYERAVAAAEKLTLCALDETHEDMRVCVDKLISIAEKGPGVPVVQVVVSAITAHCEADHIQDCAGLINALGVLANMADYSKAAQHAIVELLVSAAVPWLPVEFNAAIATLQNPSHELLHALAEKTAEPPHEMDVRQPAAGAVQDMHTALLLAASAAAATHFRNLEANQELGREEGRDGSSHAARRIRRLVTDNMDAASSEEGRTWRRLHSEAGSQAKENWERMHPYDREAWVSSHHGLRPLSLQWEAARGRYSSLEEPAKVALHLEHMRRHPEYDEAEEELHQDRVVSALRAMSNLRHPGKDGVERICEWLTHHDEHLAKAAALALRNYQNEHAEAHLLALLHDHSDAREAGRHEHRQETVIKGLRTLLDWDRVSERMLAAAVRRLLRIPKSSFHIAEAEGPGGTAKRAATLVCTRKCIQYCNPHGQRAHCKRRCEHGCEHEITIASLLAALVRKSMLQQAAGNHTSHLQVLLREHAHEAHASWHTGWRNQSMVRHAAHPVWENVRHSGHRQMREWLQRQDTSPQWSDSPGIENRTASLALSAESHGRRLSFWSFLPNLEDYTLTFLDIIIQHPPQGAVATWACPSRRPANTAPRGWQHRCCSTRNTLPHLPGPRLPSRSRLALPSRPPPPPTPAAGDTRCTF